MAHFGTVFSVLGRVFMVLTLGLAIIGTAAAEPTVIRFSHVVTRDTPKGLAAEKFKQLAERYTQGAVQVDVYPDSQLYTDREELQALQLGLVEMLAPSFAKFGSLGVTSFEVFDLPFLFGSLDDLHRVTNGPIGEDMLAELESKGIRGLAFWDNGFKIMTANVPLIAPTDFAGLNMRIQPSGVLAAQIRALGGVPVPMGLSETYRALSSGLVDGTENVPSNLYSQHFNDVQSDATISNHGVLGYVVVVNKDFWDRLPKDLRVNLDRAIAETTAYANGIACESNDIALAAIAASGTTAIHTLTDSQRAAWKAALLPVHDEMKSRIGADLVVRVQAEAGFTSGN